MHESYSQHGEDIIIFSLLFSRLGLKTTEVSYIDIGAYNPIQMSNTYMLYKHKIRGITVEPDIKAVDDFIKTRPNDLHIVGVCSDKDGTIKFHKKDIPSLSTCIAANSRNIDNIKGTRTLGITSVNTHRLDSICYSHNINPTVVSIDTEGMERDVLKGFGNIRPLCLCVETEILSDAIGKKDIDLIKHVEKMGYSIYADTHINTIFLKN